MIYTKTTNASRRAALPAPVVLTSAPTTISGTKVGEESISFYAPRWFRRQNKGRTYREYAAALKQQLLRRVLLAGGPLDVEIQHS